MANVLHKNTIYVDATGDLIEKPARIYKILVSATAANAQVVIADSGASKNKLDLRVATSGATQVFDFGDTPILFDNGIEVVTLTNAVATVIYTQG